MPKMKRVLIVDDEPDLAETLRLRIACGGPFAVEIAGDGEEGLEKASRGEPPAVVIVDVAMPKLDGWEVCRRLRADPRFDRTALVVMTAFLSDGLKRKAADAGAARLLIKPFSEAEMVSAVRRLS